MQVEARTQLSIVLCGTLKQIGVCDASNGEREKEKEEKRTGE
jgi:hypothetical protein